MNFEELIVKLAVILAHLNIRYAITGGYAVSVWGRPRSTLDIDVVIELERIKIDPLVASLRGISKINYVEEPRGNFNFIEGETGMKIDFMVIGDDAYSRMKLERRISKIINGQEVYFLAPEDLILSKLVWYQSSLSTRHLEDIESVFSISGDQMNSNYLELWGKKLGVLDILKKCHGK